MTEKTGITPSSLHAPTSVVDPAVHTKHLTKVYGRGETSVCALDDVTVHIPRGKLTAIMGPSGSGKSTLMHCMAGLEAATSGEIWLGDTPVCKQSQRKLTKLRRDKIGFIFQAFNLVPTLSASENITLPSDIAHRKVDRERMAKLVETLGLAERLNHRPSELSGGQQQRVAIARALVSSPQVVFADEPTGNLDSQSTEQVLKYLRHVVDTYDQTVVMVTHEAQAASYADHVLFLTDGHVVAQLDNPDEDSVLAALRVVSDTDRLAKVLAAGNAEEIDAEQSEITSDSTYDVTKLSNILQRSGLDLDDHVATEVAVLLAATGEIPVVRTAAKTQHFDTPQIPSATTDMTAFSALMPPPNIVAPPQMDPLAMPLKTDTAIDNAEISREANTAIPAVTMAADAAANSAEATAANPDTTVAMPNALTEIPNAPVTTTATAEASGTYTATPDITATTGKETAIAPETEVAHELRKSSQAKTRPRVVEEAANSNTIIAAILARAEQRMRDNGLTGKN